MKLFQALVLSLALLVAAPLSSQAQDEDSVPTVLVHVTSDDVWSGQAAFSFARGIQEAGGNVAVFLNVRAVALANASVPQHVEAMTGKTPHDMVAEIIAAGGRVFVCPGCTRQAGLDVAERIDGIEPGGPDLLAIMMAPGTRIITF